MESSSGDAMVVVQLECKVQEGNRASGFRWFPFESSSGGAEGVHRVKKVGMSSGALSLDNKSIIDQTTVEEDAMGVVRCDEHGFLVVRVVYRGVGAGAWCSHRCPVALAPVAVAKGEDVGSHDDVKACKNTLHRESGG